MVVETELISQVGFPIGAFLLMFYFATTTLKENTKAITALKEMIASKFK